MPDLPFDLKYTLCGIDTKGATIDWNIHRTSRDISLQIVFHLSKFPSKIKKAAKPPAGVKPCVGKKNKPHKSPSRLARDRRRLELFKRKKSELKHAKNVSKILQPSATDTQPSETPEVLESDAGSEPSPLPISSPAGSPAEELQGQATTVKSDHHHEIRKQNNDRFIIKKYNDNDNITLKFNFGGAVLGSEVGPDGKPRILDATPAIKPSISVFDNIFKLKQNMAAMLNSLDTIPVDCLQPKNIVVHCLAPDPYGQYSWINAPDCLPIWQVLLNSKDIPKYSLMYDISLCPHLLKY